METSPARLVLDDPLPPHYAWNVRMLVADSALFSLAMSFVGSTTILPSLLVKLSASEVVVGLASGLIGGAWLLPQLFVASAMARVRRLVPTIAVGAWISRPLFLVMALIIALFGRTAPKTTIAVLLIGFTIFFALDAVVSLPWFQFVGKALPPRRRGRVLGLSQSLGALAGIGAGVVVRFVLSPNSAWGFPDNYAILFVLAGLCLLGAALALTLLREPPATGSEKSSPRLREVLSLLPRILIDDRPFRHLVQVRLAAGFVSMASAFYILYATRELGLGIEVTGLFVSAQVVGSLASGLVTGLVQDRLGPLAHLRVVIIMSVLAPLLALASGPLFRILGQGVLYPYVLLYFFLGLYVSSPTWPYFNWILEYVGETRRPIYIGMINTLGAISMLAPAMGGWIARRISYPAVFGTAILFAAIAFVLSLRLPDTRKMTKGPAQQ